MSRSLGLREDQREGAMLVALIARLFPLDRSGPIASKLAPTGDLVYPGNQAKCGNAFAPTGDLDYPGNGSNVGASLLAMGPVQPVQH